MTKKDTRSYKCVIGTIMSKPNEVIYEPTLSGRKLGVWIGYCKGDKIHKEHLFRIITLPKWHILNSTKDIFKQPYKDSSAKRLFEPMKYLRCPVGKVYMKYQKTLSDKLGMEGVDIYKCKGNSKGAGHKEHYLRIHHGMLESNKIGIIIVAIENS